MFSLYKCIFEHFITWSTDQMQHVFLREITIPLCLDTTFRVAAVSGETLVNIRYEHCDEYIMHMEWQQTCGLKKELEITCQHRYTLGLFSVLIKPQAHVHKTICFNKNFS